MQSFSPKGFTLVELMVALTIGTLLVAIGLPSIANAVASSRHNAAVRQLTSDIRKARSQAISTSWEYRVVGFDADGSSRKNQYRILARRNTTTAWPADDAAPLQSSTQFAGPWISLNDSFKGVNIDGKTARFEVTFDARGAAPAVDTSFNPFRVTSDSHTTTLVVSVSGGIQLQ